MGRILAFVPDADTPGIYDATRAFQPEALRFVRHHGGSAADVWRFPATGPMPRRREPVARALGASIEPVDKLAFVCHGWRSGLQCGFNVENVASLAALIAGRCTPDAYVLLYACSTAQEGPANDPAGTAGDGGFADVLRDACERLGRRVTVFGHSKAGHCAVNPFARAFRPETGGKGGQWYVDPKATYWRKWQTELREPMSTLRWRFPFMSTTQIRDELIGPPLAVG